MVTGKLPARGGERYGVNAMAVVKGERGGKERLLRGPAKKRVDQGTAKVGRGTLLGKRDLRAHGPKRKNPLRR